MSGKINVIKRDGKGEPFDVEKINRVLSWATQDISGVSLSEVEINTKLNIR